MKTQDRIALLYAASILGMGGVAYARGRRGMDLLTDAALYGLAVGTAANGLWYVASSEEPLSGWLPSQSQMGSMSERAVKLLTNVDASSLYKEMKTSGVKIAPVPDDPSIVAQDEE